MRILTSKQTQGDDSVVLQIFTVLIITLSCCVWGQFRLERFDCRRNNQKGGGKDKKRFHHTFAQRG